MSSLAASRADGYYFPPDYDPEKHGSLNKAKLNLQFRGQHPLRERAKKLDQGILVIRFEMPFNVWCGGCNHLIGKGVRFNAEKEQIGMYFSTRIWRFSMRCPSCSNPIHVETDPKNTEYEVTKGARRKVETWTAANSETIELPDKDEQQAAAPADDPFQRLERGDQDRKTGRSLAARVADLHRDSEFKFKDDYTMNKRLRQDNRQQRHSDKQLDSRRQEYGLSDDVKLLPEDVEDRLASSAVEFGDPNVFMKKLQKRRSEIRQQSIFSPSALTTAAKQSKPSTSLSGQKRLNKARRKPSKAS